MSEPVDLRILTPDLAVEEIAAVTSVVTAMIEEQRSEAERDAIRPVSGWRRAVEPFADRERGTQAWRRAVR